MNGKGEKGEERKEDRMYGGATLRRSESREYVARVPSRMYAPIEQFKLCVWPLSASALPSFGSARA
eukprot:6204183-Pleurochrysis_carterae.AAC.3